MPDRKLLHIIHEPALPAVMTIDGIEQRIIRITVTADEMAVLYEPPDEGPDDA